MLGTVLIIDDCATTATPLEIVLTGMPGVEVLLVSNAPEALKILTNRAYKVCAIVTDLHLPKMNGFELIETIRRDGQYATLPIVVVTGDGNPATRSRAFQTGANAYFPKPYSPVHLRQELERLLYAS